MKLAPQILSELQARLAASDRFNDSTLIFMSDDQRELFVQFNEQHDARKFMIDHYAKLGITDTVQTLSSAEEKGVYTFVVPEQYYQADLQVIQQEAVISSRPRAASDVERGATAPGLARSPSLPSFGVNAKAAHLSAVPKPIPIPTLHHTTSVVGPNHPVGHITIGAATEPFTEDSLPTIDALPAEQQKTFLQKICCCFFRAKPQVETQVETQVEKAATEQTPLITP